MPDFNPSGFTCTGNLSGSAYSSNMNQVFSIENGYATSLYKGQLVTKTTASAYIVPTVGTPIGDVIPTLGTYVSAQWYDSSLGILKGGYWPAGTTTLGSVDPLCWVVSDPLALYKAQTQAPSGLANTATLGNYLLVDGSGNNFTGNSTSSVGAANQTSTNILKLWGLTTDVNNGWGVPNPYVKVSINNHVFKAGTAGLGS